MFYMSTDDYRLLQMLEASGVIVNRSHWLSLHIRKAAEDAGVRQAVKQAIERKKEELAELERLDAQCDKIEIDRTLLWEKLVAQWNKNHEYSPYSKRPTRQSERFWLETRKKVLAVCRPGKTVDEVIDELTQEGNRDGKARDVAQDTR